MGAAAHLLTLQALADPATAVGAAALEEKQPDLLGEVDVLLAALALHLLLVGVEAARADLKRRA